MTTELYRECDRWELTFSHIPVPAIGEWITVSDKGIGEVFCQVTWILAQVCPAAPLLYR